MNKKASRRFRRFGIFLLIVPIGLWSFVKDDNYFEISKNLEIFTSIYKELNIFYVDDTKPGELMTTGINSMLKSLDPYTIYFPESRIEEARFAQTGKYGGIGIRTVSEGDDYYVSEIFEEMPGAEAGLLPGDKIISIDGESVSGLTEEELGLLIKGQSGTSIKVEVDRMTESSNLTFEVFRTEVEIPPVPYSGMLDDDTGYIKLSTFSRTASMEVKRAFAALKKDNEMSRLVLDLRGNGGGLLREAINIVNLFVPKNTLVVKTKGKLDEWNKTYNTLTDPVAENMPLIVLVDGRSASASEIVSGALQDMDRAVVLGTQSFGKGLVQQTKDIAFNARLKLTVAKYYTPSGRCIQKIDYSNRVNGEALAIDKENIKAFETTNGRPVYDGEGVRPDVDIFEEESSELMSGLTKRNTLFHYATKFYFEHDSISDPKEFRLSDSQYEEFVQFAIDQNLDYTTESEIEFDRFISVLKEEGDYDLLSEELDLVKGKLGPKTGEDLNRFKELIKGELEAEIAGRYYYAYGEVTNRLLIDPFIKESKTVFNGGYDKILAGNE